jgi:hypothetical protein
MCTAGSSCGAWGSRPGPYLDGVVGLAKVLWFNLQRSTVLGRVCGALSAAAGLVPAPALQPPAVVMQGICCASAVVHGSLQIAAALHTVCPGQLS